MNWTMGMGEASFSALLADRERKGVIAGLREALEIVTREVVEWGTIGDGIGDQIAEEATKSIRSRISDLESNT